MNAQPAPASPANSMERKPAYPSFKDKLNSHGIALRRGVCSTLQVNVGYLCNQSCKHCHLEAGPENARTMSRDTAAQVAAFAESHRFATGDLTGGAVEMCADFPFLVERIRPHVEKLIVRPNLTAAAARMDFYAALYRAHSAIVITSLPSPNRAQTDAQRGAGSFDRIIAGLLALNKAGYGVPGGGLELNLVSNPAGAFLPPDQKATEERFRAELRRKHGVEFNSLFLFANVPLGRFGQWLTESGNQTAYMEKLRDGFNPCAAGEAMCRTLISVGWDGRLYDCDFNQAAGLPLGGKTTHISDLATPPEPGAPIAVGEHCWACMAGSGFT